MSGNYLYKLSLSDTAWKIYESEPYNFDAVFTMIISAPSEENARKIANDREKSNNNSDTVYFWCNSKQAEYVDCVVIGAAFVNTGIVCSDEKHKDKEID
jgi:hypothetical protein